MATWEGRPMVITTIGMGEGHHLGHKNCRFWRHANASAHIMLSYPWRMKVRSSFSIIDSSCGWQGVSGIYLELQPYSKEALVVNISGAFRAFRAWCKRHVTWLSGRVLPFVPPITQLMLTSKQVFASMPASQVGSPSITPAACLFSCAWWKITDDDERFLTMIDDDW